MVAALVEVPGELVAVSAAEDVVAVLLPPFVADAAPDAEPVDVAAAVVLAVLEFEVVMLEVLAADVLPVTVADVLADVEPVVFDAEVLVVAAAAAPATPELVEEEEHPTAIKADTKQMPVRNSRKILEADVSRNPLSPLSFRFNTCSAF